MIESRAKHKQLNEEGVSEMPVRGAVAVGVCAGELVAVVVRGGPTRKLIKKSSLEI